MPVPGDALPGRRRPRRPGRSASALPPQLTLLFVWVAVVAIATILVPLNDAVAGVGMLTLLIVLVAAGRAIRRAPKGDGSWRLLFLGVVLAASGVLPFTLRELAGMPIPGLAGHLLLFAAYGTLAAGLSRLARPASRRRGHDLDAVVDMSVVAVLASTLLWQFVGPVVLAGDGIDLLMVGLTLAHSVFIVVLVSLATRAIVRRSSSVDSYLLTTGLACLTVSNLAYLTHVEPQDLGSWAATAWLIGLFLIGLSLVVHTPAGAAPDPTESDTLLPFGRVALTLAPVPVPVVVALLLEGATHPVNRWVVPLATVALTGLALLRASRLLDSARDAWTHLAARERLFQVLATNSSDAVLRVDRDGRPRSETLTLPALTRTGQAAPGHRTDIAIDLATLDGDAYHALLARAVSEPGVPSYAELPVRDRSGSQLWVGARAVDLVHDAAVGAVVINLHDITERKHAEEELTYQALHDPLTGLPNRALFRDRLEHALAKRVRSGGQAALLYLDLDGFKGVNDGLGHEHGDRLLRQVADRLSGLTRSDETVARLGGDEFAVLIERSSSADAEPTAAAERIIEAIRIPFDLDDRQVSISVSVGIATSDGGVSPTDLLRNADVAMYGAKAAGRGRCQVYEPSHDRDTDELLQLEYDLVGALERGEFELYYQPIVQLASGRTTGFEALLRWMHPQRGTIGPDRFIPILERTGAIVAVGSWVLRTACQTLADWQHRFEPSLTMSVNLSGRQLERDDLAQVVRSELDDAGIAPRDLMLEMTETFLVDNQLAADQLQRLHSLGVRIAIDDFGTGYSALAYLRRYPIDTIKIDRSFVSAIEDVGALPPLLSGLLDLGRTLQMATIAEGIEHEHQRELLHGHGCLLGQGYLFSRPLPRTDAEARLTEQPSMPSRPDVAPV